ncbi:DUF3307 domain-containing protein [Streptomyces sp. NPDC000927]|uniref:DUF3307 domain-containing protein n=1 Tax=Streptomyces sp. NPDC000927 TaxID=3154371 RepID=UPI0033169D3F
MFGTVFALLYIGHHIADYLIQTDRQATTKSSKTAKGYLANIIHATSHALTESALLVIGSSLLGLSFTLPAGAAAVAWIGVTHGFIDRRWPVTRWMRNTGSTDYIEMGGAERVDQAMHIACLGVAAGILAA